MFENKYLIQTSLALALELVVLEQVQLPLVHGHGKEARNVRDADFLTFPKVQIFVGGQAKRKKCLPDVT